MALAYLPRYPSEKTFTYLLSVTPTLPIISILRYNTQAAVSWWTWILHIGMVIIGGYFIANLALAVIFLQFTRHYAALAGTSNGSSPSDDEEDGEGCLRRISFLASVSKRC